MKCIDETKITRRRDMPLMTYLSSSGLLLQKARELRLKPVDYIANEFLAVRLEDEAYDDWVARQIQEILEVELMHDEIGRSSRKGAAHFSQRVRSVQISLADRVQMMNAFGKHPVVLACWDAIANQQVCKAA